MFLALNLLFAKKRRFDEHVNGWHQTNRTYYFYNDIIDLKNFDAKLLKIDKKLYENIDIYYIRYITIKKIDDYESIKSLNPLDLRIDHASGYIKGKMEINI